MGLLEFQKLPVNTLVGADWKTFKEITKLERNGMFVYESVPGTAVFDLAQDGSQMSFRVEGPEDAQITVDEYGAGFHFGTLAKRNNLCT